MKGLLVYLLTLRVHIGAQPHGIPAENVRQQDSTVISNSPRARTIAIKDLLITHLLSRDCAVSDKENNCCLRKSVCRIPDARSLL
jgi:hypothetical protein